MNPNIEIRQFRKADMSSAIGVYKHLCEFYNRPFNFDSAKKFLATRDFLEQYYTVVAYDQETKQVVALAFGEISTEETLDISGYIKLIYVEEKYRQQGLMTGLIQHLIAFFKQTRVDQCRIFLNNTNLPYLNYYTEKLGFNPIITIVENKLQD